MQLKIFLALLCMLIVSNSFAEPETKDLRKAINDDAVKSGNLFVCEGIALIDQGLATDRGADFLDIKTQEIICKYGMAVPSCTSKSADQPCSCPPSQWTDNKCWEKYSEFSKLKTHTH